MIKVFIIPFLGAIVSVIFSYYAYIKLKYVKKLYLGISIILINLVFSLIFSLTQEQSSFFDVLRQNVGAYLLIILLITQKSGHYEHQTKKGKKDRRFKKNHFHDTTNYKLRNFFLPIVLPVWIFFAFIMLPKIVSFITSLLFS